MKKIDLGQTVGILANIGVIAGIIFLGVELQQNNRLMSSEAEYNLLQNRTDSDIVGNPEIAAFWFKVNSGAPLTELERYRVDAWAARTIVN